MYIVVGRSSYLINKFKKKKKKRFSSMKSPSLYLLFVIYNFSHTTLIQVIMIKWMTNGSVNSISNFLLLIIFWEYLCYFIHLSITCGFTIITRWILNWQHECIWMTVQRGNPLLMARITRACYVCNHGSFFAICERILDVTGTIRWESIRFDERSRSMS